MTTVTIKGHIFARRLDPWDSDKASNVHGGYAYSFFPFENFQGYCQLGTFNVEVPLLDSFIPELARHSLELLGRKQEALDKDYSTASGLVKAEMSLIMGTE